ncbi:MAG TPA: T9SS type A sorting domain-containing protein [bacterium (Candidatus Stahlbacteria)]|nr:T9SS type A sorting domain-containing protein [Candidatus Stahlbacteria bacterium]
MTLSLLFIIVTNAAPVYGYQVINVFPHDSSAWTQGLIYEDGYLYEGTGLYGGSSLRKVELETGSIVKIFNLDSQYFGEGITKYDTNLIQLTWRNSVGFVYVEKETFELIDTFAYSTEGWGLTHDNNYLIMSDGSNVIHFLDPTTYQEVYQIEVQEDGNPITSLNELEYIQGKIYANVWRTDSIVIIDPTNGDVVGWLNLKGLLNNYPIRIPDVLNGIAFDREGVRLFVTGKRWPRLFEIEVDPINYPPQILSYEPSSPCSVMVDSTLRLLVVAIDPDSSDRLVYTWSINGVIDTTAHDSVYYYSNNVVTTDTVKVVVSDQMYADSVSWVIYVYSIGVNEGPPNFPERLMLDFSNPSGSDLIIHFNLLQKDLILLRLYDSCGRLMRNLINETRGAGKYKFSLSIRDLNPGIYFVRLDAGSRTRIRKLILVR